MEASKALIVKKKLTDTQYIILYFFLYSFIGWLMETFYSLLVLGHFTNRGFLVGPICPIYGFGAILMILFISQYKKNSIKLFFSTQACPLYVLLISPYLIPLAILLSLS